MQPELSESSTPTQNPSGRSLAGSFVSSVAWSAAAKWSAQLTTWLSTIFVARLLSAEDYGVMGMAALFLGVVSMLSEMGVGLSVLILRDLTDEQIGQLNTVAVLMGAAGCLVTVIAAAPLGRLFHNAELPAVLRVISVTFLVGGLRTVPFALLRRELRFPRIAAIDAVAGMTSAVTVVVLAYLRFGYWALAAGQLSLLVTSTALQLLSRPHAFGIPRWATLQPAITFSKRVVVGNLSWYVYSNADFFVAGRFLGTTALGVYSFGWNLTTVVLEKITSLVNGVTPAYFSALQHDTEGVSRLILGVTEALSLVVFPATIGIALVAPDLVPVLFGDKWVPAVPVVQLLSLYGTMRMLRPVVNNALLNAGEVRFQMWMGVSSALIFPAAFFVAAPYGPTGIAAAWVLLYPASMVAVYGRLFHLRITSPWQYLRALAPAAVGSASMAVGVLAIRAIAFASAPAPARLAASVTLGATIYLLTLWLGYRSRIERFARILTAARREVAPKAA